MVSFAQGLRKIEALLIYRPQLSGRDHEDQTMQYDWSGVRTRRIRRLKMTMWTALALAAVASPAVLMPGVDLAPLLSMVW